MSYLSGKRGVRIKREKKGKTKFHRTRAKKKWDKNTTTEGSAVMGKKRSDKRFDGKSWCVVSDSTDRHNRTDCKPSVEQIGRL